MGHRANFAIRDEGRVQVFSSHWGALTVPRDVFWGPEFAEAFIRQHEPTSEWLDTVWAEGGASICKDTKKLAFFGGESIAYGPERELFFQMMKSIYAKSGWTVQWVDDLRGVAECVGVPGEQVLAAFHPPLPLSPDDDGKHAWNGSLRTMVGRRTEHGWEDHFSSQGAALWLATGVDALATVGELPSFEQAREIHATRKLHRWEKERSPFRLSGIVLIDEDAKTIVSNDYGLRDPRLVAHLMERWPGWSLSHVSGPADAFEAMDRELLDEIARPVAAPVDAEAKPEPERGELVARIAEALLGESLGESLPVATADKADISLFVSPPDGRPSRDVAAKLFSLALAETNAV